MSKIVVFEVDGKFEILMLPGTFEHAKVVEALTDCLPSYAGFCDISVEGGRLSISVFGSSVTLGLDTPRNTVVKEAIKQAWG